MINEATNILNALPSHSAPVASASDAPVRVHFGYLDSFRGLAALWVLLSHVWEGEIGYEPQHGIYGLLTNWILYAHYAVDVFIVLSGFCLMLPVAKSGSLKGGARKFYTRRIHRILPPFYICLGIGILIYFASSKVGRVQHVSLSTKMVMTNVLLLQDLFPQFNKINASLWSVAVECKIYILFPLIVWIYFRYKSYAVLAFAAAVSCALTACFHAVKPDMALSLTCPWYVLLFAIGVCAGAAVSSADLSAKISEWRVQCGIWLLLAIIVLKLCPLPNAGEKNYLVQYLPMIDVIIGGLAASIMVLIHHQLITRQRRPWLDFLSWSPLVQTGRFAYSIYLMHASCLVIITAVVKRLVSSGMPESAGKLCVFIIGIPLTLAGCYLFYLKCEVPFINRARTVKR